MKSEKHNRSENGRPKCVLICGPNGAGKTTFAQEYLPREGQIVHFVNADLIASGLSPLNPELAHISAGKLFLKELDRLALEKKDFAFETTLSGLAYVEKIRKWKTLGYQVEIIYLKLSSPALSLRRVAERVRQGGHSIPADVIRRRFFSRVATFY